MTLRPWRELIAPHRDVLSGTYQEAEFAADLSKVIRGDASDEYQNPVLFFERTYITEGMRLLLNSVVRRLAGRGGDPVVQLQTAFGGGKTHTLLAVYHIASSERRAAELAGVPPIIDEAGVAELPRARVAVIDGNDRAPSQPLRRDGHTIKTLWGDLAYQLGKADGFEMVAAADADGTSPGKEVLARLFTRFAPCVLLLDELVAYIRQLEDGKTYPGGTFESNLSFLQALTEAASQVPTTMVLASLPESKIEAGGQRGQQALAHIEKIFGRVEAVWKPVATTEGFEIVRRRLFGTVSDADARDEVCRAFAGLYVAHPGQFPADTAEASYFERLREAYPIHPEVFERLYGDWSTLEKFQRTRGVLRLMAMVIHRLWADGNQDLMITPGSLPLYDAQVANELVRYLPQGWQPVIERDVDGRQSLPSQLDAQDARLGSLQAAARVARTIFLGSAPAVAGQRVRGISDQRVRLGCSQPGQQVGRFDDALRRLLDQLHYLFTNNERNRFWYDTRPNLRREMEDRMSRFEPGEHLLPEVQKRLRQLLKGGPFAGVHVFTPHEDIPDDESLRLVVVAPPAAHRGRTRDTLAVRAAADINGRRGVQGRTNQNRLIYLAADEEALQQVWSQAKRFLSWDSIVEDTRLLNLDQYQIAEAMQSRDDADKRLNGAVREAFRWVLTPAQEARPKGGLSDVFWEEVSISPSAQSVVEAVCKAVEDQERLIRRWSPIHLRSLLQTWFWSDERPDVSTLEVWKAFCAYTYLPRLIERQVFEETVAAGVTSRDFFGYAAAKEGGRYAGLLFGSAGAVFVDANSLLVRAEAAAAQLDRERQEHESREPVVGVGGATLRIPEVGGGQVGDDASPPTGGQSVAPPGVYKRFHGRVTLNPLSMGLDAARIAEEIVQHFSSDYGTQVTLSLEIEAYAPHGINEKTIRIARENARSLDFQAAEFEAE